MHASSLGDPVRVLLIEDNGDYAEVTRRWLVRFGAEVLVAATAADALEGAARLRPELVLSDVVLPDGNGIELIPRLRERIRDVVPYCVATSGFVGELDGRSSLPMRVDRFLPKPIEPRTLQALVEAARGRRSARPSA